MRVVLDTNIIVSALLVPLGPSALTLALGLRRHFQICISPAVLAEYHEVLRRPRFSRLPPGYIQDALQHIEKTSRLVHPAGRLKISAHESDNRLYECAEACQADFLVTGNTKHFLSQHGETRIVTPRRFLEFLAESSE